MFTIAILLIKASVERIHYRIDSKDLSNNTNDAACDSCHLVHALDQVVDEVLSVAVVTALNVMQSLLVHASLHSDTKQ